MDGFDEFEYLGHIHYQCCKCGRCFCGEDVQWMYHECESGYEPQYDDSFSFDDIKEFVTGARDWVDEYARGDLCVACALADKCTRRKLLAELNLSTNDNLKYPCAWDILYDIIEGYEDGN